MTEDFERIDWIEATAAELRITICSSATGYYEIHIGQVTIPGRTLRDALDAAIKATSERSL